jgi:hypothetical protein
MRRRRLTMMLVLALGVAWLVYSFLGTFENWPWTMRQIYRSGSIEGMTIGSTKADTMDQILLRQKQGALDTVVLIDDAGVLVAQEHAGSPLTTDASQRITHADHWSIRSRQCGDHMMKPICTIKLEFSNDRLLRIVHETYFGPTDL